MLAIWYVEDTAKTWKKLRCSGETKTELFLAYTQNASCSVKLTLHINLSTQSPTQIMVLAGLCYGDCYLQQ